VEIKSAAERTDAGTDSTRAASVTIITRGLTSPVAFTLPVFGATL
jgi:hypothetical protein